MAEKVKEFKGGPGSRGRGPKPKVDNPGIIMKRLFGMLFKSYGAALIVVADPIPNVEKVIFELVSAAPNISA